MFNYAFLLSEDDVGMKKELFAFHLHPPLGPFSPLPLASKKNTDESSRAVEKSEVILIIRCGSDLTIDTSCYDLKRVERLQFVVGKTTTTTTNHYKLHDPRLDYHQLDIRGATA